MKRKKEEGVVEKRERRRPVPAKRSILRSFLWKFLKKREKYLPKTAFRMAAM